MRLPCRDNKLLNQSGLRLRVMRPDIVPEYQVSSFFRASVTDKSRQIPQGIAHYVVKEHLLITSYSVLLCKSVVALLERAKTASPYSRPSLTKPTTSNFLHRYVPKLFKVFKCA